MTDADKRERIIAAAYDVLSQKGYDRASTKEIATTAGVAQGLINYYFPSKDQLFAEVFRRETQRYCNSFDAVFEVDPNEPLTMEAIAKVMEVPKSRVLDEPEWFRLRYELFAIGLRNEAALPILKDMLEIKTRHVAKIVKDLTGLPSEQSEGLAAILHSVIEGLALQKIADPDFKYDEAYAVLSQMLGAYYATFCEKGET